MYVLINKQLSFCLRKNTHMFFVGSKNLLNPPIIMVQWKMGCWKMSRVYKGAMLIQFSLPSCFTPRRSKPPAAQPGNPNHPPNARLQWSKSVAKTSALFCKADKCTKEPQLSTGFCGKVFKKSRESLGLSVFKRFFVV